MVFGIQILEPSGWGIVALVAMAVLRGYLVPRRILEDAHEEAERWREAYETEREARQRLVEHSQAGLEAARTTAAVLRATLPAGGAVAGDGGRDADPVAT